MVRNRKLSLKKLQNKIETFCGYKPKLLMNGNYQICVSPVEMAMLLLGDNVRILALNYRNAIGEYVTHVTYKKREFLTTSLKPLSFTRYEVIKLLLSSK